MAVNLREKFALPGTHRVNNRMEHNIVAADRQLQSQNWPWSRDSKQHDNHQQQQQQQQQQHVEHHPQPAQLFNNMSISKFQRGEVCAGNEEKEEEWCMLAMVVILGDVSTLLILIEDCWFQDQFHLSGSNNDTMAATTTSETRTNNRCNGRCSSGKTWFNNCDREMGHDPWPCWTPTTIQ